MSNGWDYTKDEFKKALENAGIGKGDIVFTHVGYAFLGKPKDCVNNEQVCQMILDAFLEIIGDNGTLLVPTYTYSFCENQDFDVNNSPSTIGPFTEFFRKQKNALRSIEPIFSVSGIGPKTDELFTNLPSTSFGKDSIYDRLIKNNGKICMIGIPLKYATFRHHIEEVANIPSRFIKKFSGNIIQNNKKYFQEWEYYVRHLNNDNCKPDGSKLENLIREQKLCNVIKVGRGEILTIDSKKYFDFGFNHLKKDPWLTSSGSSMKNIN